MSNIENTTEWGIINKLEAQQIEKTLKINLKMNKYKTRPDPCCEDYEYHQSGHSHRSGDVWELFLLNQKRHKLQMSYNKLKETEKQAIAERSKKICFFTINPCKEHTIQTLQATMVNFLKKKYLQEVDVMWTFEQRGETPEDAGRGLHIHILFKKPSGKNTQPSMIINETFNTFKNLYGSLSPNSRTAILASAYKIYPIEFYNEKLEYMKGNKYINAEDKQQKLKIDTIFRQINNLQLIYKQDAQKKKPPST